MIYILSQAIILDRITESIVYIEMERLKSIEEHETEIIQDYDCNNER